ncbi:hypothetical protein [Shinella zoogloeoides]|uniref:hypothetical protein n=1 Tax=Shinella zoogloeoides TaxID=352475 RepID=UPI0013C2B007|nr:hypothetical protein [Shinella zoogloeoides]
MPEMGKQFSRSRFEKQTVTIHSALDVGTRPRDPTISQIQWSHLYEVREQIGQFAVFQFDRSRRAAGRGDIETQF